MARVGPQRHKGKINLPLNVPFPKIICHKLFHTCKTVTHHATVFVFLTSVAVSRVNIENKALQKRPLQENRDWSLPLHNH